MVSRALSAYLNDHLGGSTVGVGLADQIAGRASGRLAEAIGPIAREIHEDRATLLALMERLDVGRDRLKEAGAVVGDKVGRVKFRGLTSGTPEAGLFAAVEALTLGVAGKLALWTALLELTPTHPELDAEELRALAARATAQRDALEAERGAMARNALA